MNMKYIISENRLQNIFDIFMDSQYGLTYNPKNREFRTERGSIFGDFWEQRFLYAYLSDEGYLKAMFGDDVNKLLLTYLRKKFPEVGIRGIGNSPPESLL